MTTIIAVLAFHSHAGVVEFTNAQAWQQATSGQYSTIDFTGFPIDTFITDQYADEGILFAGTNLILGPSGGFVNDSWGLFGPAGIRFTLDAPQNWVAVDYSGGVKFQLLNNGTIVYTSIFFQPGGVGNFAGLVSSMPFDEVYILRPPPNENTVFIDDLHWGAAVPAPGALALLAVALIRGRRRRA